MGRHGRGDLIGLQDRHRQCNLALFVIVIVIPSAAAAWRVPGRGNLGDMGCVFRQMLAMSWPITPAWERGEIRVLTAQQRPLSVNAHVRNKKKFGLQ